MKNSDSRQKLRQIILTILGILLVAALFCLAIAFPTYYSMLYDKNTLNKLNYKDIVVNTYETSYETFPDKLRSFARVYGEEGKIHAIRIGKPEIWMDKQELTEIANRELEVMKNNGMLTSILSENIALKAKKLSVCERYTIYKTQSEDDLQGISFWKLVYKKPKKTITLYLDEEFHKVYYLDIMFKQKLDPKTSSTHGTSYSDSNNQIDTIFYDWWNGIYHYYGIDAYELQSSTNIVASWTMIQNLEGYIEFDGTHSIRLYETWFYSETKTDRLHKHWCMGMPIEGMIQF